MKKILVPGALFVVAFASAAIAQSGSNPETSGKPGPVVGQTQLGVSVTELSWVATGYRASKILGSHVYNDRNEKVGKLADLIIKPDGNVSIAVLDVGGFLGMDTHTVAIPVGRFSGVSPKIVLPGATKEALKALPEFEYEKTSRRGS